jgi:hypothetical protein
MLEAEAKTMPIDMLGAFFPPPARLDPDRPHRVGKTDRDGGAGRRPEPERKRRRAPGEEEAEEEQAPDKGHRISVEA